MTEYDDLLKAQPVGSWFWMLEGGLRGALAHKYRKNRMDIYPPGRPDVVKALSLEGWRWGKPEPISEDEGLRLVALFAIAPDEFMKEASRDPQTHLPEA